MRVREENGRSLISTDTLALRRENKDQFVLLESSISECVEERCYRERAHLESSISECVESQPGEASFNFDSPSKSHLFQPESIARPDRAKFAPFYSTVS
jgi:hypothetical protein